MTGKTDDQVPQSRGLRELSDPTAVERAFELARSGRCAGVAQIRAQLKAEGHSGAQIWGPSLTRQLRALCNAAATLPQEQ